VLSDCFMQILQTILPYASTLVPLLMQPNPFPHGYKRPYTFTTSDSQNHHQAIQADQMAHQISLLNQYLPQPNPGTNEPYRTVEETSTLPPQQPLPFARPKPLHLRPPNQIKSLSPRSPPAHHVFVYRHRFIPMVLSLDEEFSTLRDDIQRLFGLSVLPRLRIILDQSSGVAE